MNLLLTIKSLYAVNGVVAVLLYLPQILKAWNDRKHALSISLLSFGGWSIGSLVTALYAWLFVGDSMFTAVSLGNMAGSGCVFILALRCRLGVLDNFPPSKVSPARDEANRVAGLAEQLP
jgi:uncharacterized protein with PQ loop repeat